MEHITELTSESEQNYNNIISQFKSKLQMISSNSRTQSTNTNENIIVKNKLGEMIPITINQLSYAKITTFHTPFLF